MGMAGIQQAAKDPKMLAQLMQDMQVSCQNGVLIELGACFDTIAKLLWLSIAYYCHDHMHNTHAISSSPLHQTLKGSGTNGRGKENDGIKGMEEENEGINK